jgi:hypothetical protein
MSASTCEGLLRKVLPATAARGKRAPRKGVRPRVAR